MRCAISVILAIAVFLGVISLPAEAAKRQLLTAEIYSDTLSAVLEAEEKNQGGSLCAAYAENGLAGESSADWFILTQLCAGVEDDYERYAAAAGDALAKRLADPDKYYLTELARTAAVISLCGGTAPDLGGLSLDNAGDNELIWVGIATRVSGGGCGELLHILYTRQQADGGFGFGESSDPDITAMALNILPQESEQTAAAVGYLRDYFTQSGGEISCETAAQMIIGLCAQGINPSQSGDFCGADGVRLTDILLSKYAGGGFSHSGEEEANEISTTQAAAALAALGYYGVSGKAVFDGDFRQVEIFAEENPAAEGFDDYDRAILSSLEKPHACDRQTLEALREKAVLGGSEEDISNEIETKLKESTEICERIEDLNGRIRKRLYPAEKTNIFDLPQIVEVNAEILQFDECDRPLILSAQKLSARQRELTAQAAAMAAVTVIVAVVGVIYIKRKKNHGKKSN